MSSTKVKPSLEKAEVFVRQWLTLNLPLTLNQGTQSLAQDSICKGGTV